MAETMTKGKSRGATGAGGRELPALRVRYWRRMKLQRVYSAEVSWSKSERPPRGEVTVRLIVPGAQVLPSEHTLDSAKADDKALFYVTPLAKGRLPEPRLEILTGERKVQEIPLPTKVVSQRLSWLLLALTFIVPYLFLHYVTYSPLAKDELGLKLESQRAKQADSQKPAPGKPAAKPVKKPDKDDADPADLSGKSDVTIKLEPYIKRVANAEYDVEKFLKDNLPSTPDVLKDIGGVDSTLKGARSEFAKGYAWLVAVSGPDNWPMAFYLFLILLGLTLISAFMHSSKRRKAYGKPIPMPKVAVADEEEE